MRISSINLYNKNIHFAGTPQVLNLSADNVANYNSLANGSYLDVHDDLFVPENKEIRKRNLSFLDNIFWDSERKSFIDHFRKVTKFPNLSAVSENIENEFVNSINRTSQSFYNPRYQIVAAGYDETCSVGKRMALPGSDLDKAFIILRGNDTDYSFLTENNSQIVQNFKNKLWNMTDQRILSYNHDTSFPSVYTVGQIRDMILRISQFTQNMSFDKVEATKNLNEEFVDLIKASKFNILLANQLPKRMYDDSDNMVLNKENVKNFAYFIEAMRDGKKVIKTKEFDELIGSISDTPFFKYSNVSQMRAMKKAVNEGREQKTKILLRKNLKEIFENWNLTKQFEFVKTLIQYSCEDQTQFNEYFKNDRDVKENYKPLLGLLCYGDKDRRINPKFKISSDKIQIYMHKSNPTNLYQGFAPNVLWVDANEKGIIEDVLLHVDKLRKTDLFKYIDRVQSPIPNNFELPSRFYPTQFFTSNAKRIIERFL